jgi:hypothetical protein
MHATSRFPYKPSMGVSEIQHQETLASSLPWVRLIEAGQDLQSHLGWGDLSFNLMFGISWAGKSLDCVHPAFLLGPLPQVL